MNPELAHALEHLLFSHWSNTNIAVDRQMAAMKGKKAFARQMLSEGCITHETKEDMMLWKGEGHDKAMEAGDGHEHEERGSGTHDEDDWSSTSTLS